MIRKVLSYMFACVVLAGILYALIVLNLRHEARWLKDSMVITANTVAPSGACGKDVRWAKTSLPIPVWADATLDRSWEPFILEGIRVADPWYHLFVWKGWTATATVAGTITLGAAAEEDEHWAWEITDAGIYCRILWARVEVLLLRSEKGRTRAVAHALLHALGLGHSDWGEDLMYSSHSALFPFRMSNTERLLLEGAYIQ